jgi:hypothetical protein
MDRQKRCDVRSESRAAIAYIAGRLISGRHSSSVYDYARSKFINFSGTVQSGRVQVFDHETGNHFVGSGSEASINLFEYGRGAHIHLAIAGHSFSGFDYGSGTHFSGTVTGGTIAVYDYGESQYFNYSV